MARTNSSPKQIETDTSPRRPVRDKLFKVLNPRPSPKVDQKKTMQIHLPPKPIPCKLLPPLSRSAGKKAVEVEGKNRIRSVLNHSTGSLYQQKDYQPIPRLDHSSLPQHSIFPQCEILDSNYRKPNYNKPTGLSKLESRSNKLQTEWTVTSLKPLTSSKDHLERIQKRNKADVGLKKSSPCTHRKEGMVFSGPLRLEAMKLAKGVSLLDPQAVDSNSFKFNPPALSSKMRLIQSDAAVPLFSGEQLTTGPPP